jgi:hypothetical protein
VKTLDSNQNMLESRLTLTAKCTVMGRQPDPGCWISNHSMLEITVLRRFNWNAEFYITLVNGSASAHNYMRFNNQ